MKDFEEEIAQGRVRPLVLNLYELGMGYSVTVPGLNCLDSSTELFPYDDAELLECVQNERLPWFIADLLQHCPANVYYEVPMFRSLPKSLHYYII